MSTAPWAIAILSGPCAYCGGYHTGLCPRVKSIEYHGDGTVKRIEFHDTIAPDGFYSAAAVPADTDTA